MASIEIPKQAKAVIYDNPGTVSTKVVMVDVPEPGPGEVLINLYVYGEDKLNCFKTEIGHLYIMTNTWKNLPYPTQPGQVGGHEGVGKVVKLGSGAEISGIKIGDRVVPCREGTDACCEKSKVSGYYTPGTFQQYVLGPANYVTPIPDSLPSDAAAPMLCAGITVYSALKRSRARPGNWVVISGAGGGLGHIATQLASRGLGHRVIGIDHGSKRDLVLKSGAEHFLDITEFPSDDHGKALSDRVAALIGGMGAHAVIVCAASNAAYAQALKLLRVNGVMVCVGVPENDPVPIATAFPTTMVVNQLSIVGSAVGTRQEAIEALDFAARGIIKTHFRLEKMDKLTQVFEEMERGELQGRVVLDLS
ncbi:zinc-dependent alcohol dehydrogenase [Emydomyces testavorans]|uniref:Zinc-dependent alcohol dehydrogenase n=1 Tax=Emydomyces testavorans TaxID=2070801 RepID=A0AAF0DJS3_9EURO|nr:zinc-dependent alcohol dehydrogenase [Emydomyces testavorans]